MSQIREHNGIKYEILKKWRPIRNRYRLLRNYTSVTGYNRLGKPDIVTEFLQLGSDGRLFIGEGYEWDGPSGPTFDSRSFIRGSLGHDAKYQLMREGWLGQGCRWRADSEMRRDCLADGMSRFRAWYTFRSVRLFASFAARPK